MPTTFTNRKTVRTGLTGLFTAYNTATPLWAQIYSYVVPVKSFLGKSPILTILSDASETEMKNSETNPTDFTFAITSFVLVYRASDNWSSPDAADKIDDIDTVIRQIIRNNAGGISGACNSLRFSGGSQTSYESKEGFLYQVETRNVIARLASGVISP